MTHLFWEKQMEDKYLISLSVEEIMAIQKLLGHVLYHTSPELYSVAGKLDQVSNPDVIDYSSVVFYKHNHDGSPGKRYKKRKFAIGIE